MALPPNNRRQDHATRSENGRENCHAPCPSGLPVNPGNRYGR